MVEKAPIVQSFCTEDVEQIISSVIRKKHYCTNFD